MDQVRPDCSQTPPFSSSGRASDLIDRNWNWAVRNQAAMDVVMTDSKQDTRSTNSSCTSWTPPYVGCSEIGDIWEKVFVRPVI